MMMITIDNYEEWMVDYLDGTLSEANQKDFEQFLDHHPEIRKELDGINDMVLEPENISFVDKSSLLKTEASGYDIPYEEYIAIKEIETGLNEEEKQWKEVYINASDDNYKLFAAYQNTKLKSDHSILFPHKGNLKRVPVIPIFKSTTLRKVSAAAVIAVLLSIGTFPYLKKSGKNIQSVVVNDTPSLIVLPQKPQDKTAEDRQVPTSSDNTPVENKNEQQKEGVHTTHYQDDKQPDKEEIFIEPMVRKTIDIKLPNKPLNAYEIGLNAMMPIMIANNLRQAEVNELAMENHVQTESQKLSRSVKALGTGIRFINYLSGNPTTIKKYVNEDGEMVAYQLESDNISYSRKIKSMPVTN